MNQAASRWIGGFDGIGPSVRVVLAAALVFFMGLAGAGPAQSAEVPFVRSVQMALSHNPQARAARASLHAARERLVQSRAALMPGVTLSGSRTHNRTSWEVDGASTTDPGSLGLSLSQILFNRKALVAYEQSDPYVAAFAADLDATTQGVFLEVARTVVELLQARDQVSLARNNLTVTRSQLEATRARHRVGEITRTDVSQAEARLASGQADLVSAENSVAVAEARFHEVVGQAPPQGLFLPAFRDDPVVRGLEGWFRDAENRPDLRAARYRLRVSEMDVDLAAADHWPTVSLSGSASRNWNERVTNRLDPVDRYALGVSLSLPVYSGGMTTSRTDQARFQRDAERARLDRLQYQALREVEEAFLNFRSARAITHALASAVTASKAALDGVEREFQVGARTALDLLDAQNELFSVRTDHSKSRFAVLLAQFQLLKAAGRLGMDGLLVDEAPPASAPKQAGARESAGERARQEERKVLAILFAELTGMPGDAVSR